MIPTGRLANRGENDDGDDFDDSEETSAEIELRAVEHNRPPGTVRDWSNGHARGFCEVDLVFCSGNAPDTRGAHPHTRKCDSSIWWRIAKM
jgi:hypothetical protein